MKQEFIEATIQVARYELKEGTSSSYYWKSGSRILPNRMSISLNSELSKAERKGRMLIENVIGEVNGKFTTLEDSPLKQHKPFCIHSKIFQPISFPLLSYGTISVTNQEGRCTRDSEEGLLVFHQAATGVLMLYYMAGVTSNPSDLNAVFSYIENCTNQ